MQLEYEPFDDTDKRYADIQPDEQKIYVTRREDDVCFWIIQEHIRRDPEGVLSRAYSLMMPKTLKQPVDTTASSPSAPLPQHELPVPDHHRLVPV